MPYKDKEKQKERNKEYQKLHYAKKSQYYKDKAAERKNLLRVEYTKLKSELKCEFCGEDHISCLDFHHIDPGTKEINVAEAASRGWSLNRVKEEIKKCSIPLCKLS